MESFKRNFILKYGCSEDAFNDLFDKVRAKMSKSEPGDGAQGCKLEDCGQVNLGNNKTEEPLDKSIHWNDFLQELGKFGFTDHSGGSKHPVIGNPGHPHVPGVRIQNSHWGKQLEDKDVEKYAKQLNLKLGTDKTLAVNPNPTGAAKFDYISHYKKTGLLKEPEVNSWKPEVGAPSKHVSVDQLADFEAPEQWKVSKYQSLVANPDKSRAVFPVSVKRGPDDKFSITRGRHRAMAAKMSGMTHIPVVEEA